MAERYYWMKLFVDFFERHDIRLIECMPNGYAIIVFYQKMLLKSVTNEGKLFLNNHIAYTDEMLAAVTNIKIDVVKDAMKLLCDFDLVQRQDDGVIYMKEANSMTGSESSSAKRVRKHREKKALHCNGGVTKSNTEIEEEKEIDTEIDIEADVVVENAPVKGLPREPHSTEIVPMDAIDRAWHDAKMSPMSTATRKSINDYIKNGMDTYCVEYAILEADRNDARSFAYINGVLKRLRDSNITTRDALERDKKLDKKVAAGRCEGELPPDDYFRLHNSWDEI